jgi:hypothetical protein
MKSRARRRPPNADTHDCVTYHIGRTGVEQVLLVETLDIGDLVIGRVLVRGQRTRFPPMDLLDNVLMGSDAFRVKRSADPALEVLVARVARGDIVCLGRVLYIARSSIARH